MNKEYKRKVYFDLLRCIAIFMVLFNHSSKAGYMLFAEYPAGSVQHFLYLTNSILIKCGVPLFFMISGALLLNREEPLVIVLKRFIKYLCVLIVASAVTYIWSGTMGGYYEEISFRNFWKIFYTSRHATAYWYLYTYLMYILMLPVLRKIAKFMVKSEWILIVCIYVVLNTLVFFDFVIWKGEYTHNSYMTCFTMSEYVIYPLCGYYLENRINIDKINKKHVFALVALSLCIITLNAFMTDYRCLIIGSWSEAYCQLFFERYILFVAATVFIITKYIMNKIVLPVTISRTVSLCGQCTFGIYLFERIWRHMTDFIYRSVSGVFTPLISCWIWILSACVLGGFVTMILKKIPIIKNFV